MASRRTFLTTAAGISATVLAEPCFANWTQWRGPSRNGIVDNDFAWPEKLDEGAIELEWEVPLSPSYSGPIVFGDKVFVTETIAKKEERVSALSTENGEQIWQTQ